MANPPLPSVERVPLSTGFRFIHEPLGTTDKDEWSRFVGRGPELDDLVSRIVLSNGGAFLLTGYRGVGKTTFVNRVIHEVRERLPRAEALVGVSRVVDVSFNFARPLKPVELLYHILRGLHRRLVELDVLPYLDTDLRRDLELACARTSASVAVGNDSEVQNQMGTGDLNFGVPWVRLPIPLKLQRTWKTVSRQDMTYLAYDEKSAEHDLINIAQRLSRGYTERRPRWPPWPSRTPLRRIRLKVLMVFDELDKLDEGRSPTDRSPLDRVLGTLKNLFTTSGIAFVFVAGKDLHERWLEDLSKGDSIHESVFAHAQYLSGMWSDAELLCDSLVGDDARDEVRQAPTSAYAAFRKYLAFKGRGIPRRTVRGFNEFVRWDEPVPCLQFASSDLRRFRFYAGLLDTLVAAEDELLGRYRGEESVERLDKRRLGLYYATDWILQREQQEFDLNDLVAASRRMSRLIAPVEEVAPVELQRLIDVLVRGEYLETTDGGAATIVAGVKVGPRPVRYRLPRRRLLELGAFLGVFEQEAQALFKDTPTQAGPLPGTLGTFGAAPLSSRYQLVSQIARGGMSTVYLARDLRTGSEVVVKQLSPDLAKDASLRSRAAREGRVLGSFSHPGIVRVQDVLEDETSVAIVMEYVQGIPLSDLLRHGRIKDLGVAARLMTDIADAVAYIHARGVVWRDPKPANVVVSPEGRVVIMDFGIARATASESDTQTGVVIGTPAYMSPEQARGDPIDSPSDVFGMGALFYELLTGQRLYSGDSIVDIIRQIAGPAAPAVPSSVAAEASEFDDLIRRCLAKGPDERITAAEVRASLMERAAAPIALGSYVSSLQQRGVAREEDFTVLLSSVVHARVVPRPLPVPSPAAPQPAPPAVRAQEPATAISRPPSPRTEFMPAPLIRPSATPPVASPSADDTVPGTVMMRGPFPRARLEMTGTGQIIELSMNVPCRIGRSSDNDIVLDDVAASRYAAVVRPGDTIIVDTGQHPYYIEDLNSANGVLVNDQPLTGITQLRNGDVIAVGKTRLRFTAR